MDLSIRNEQVSEFRFVEELTREAFWNVHVPGCNEHFLLHNLRQSEDFIKKLDLVSEHEGRVIGHIVYTRAVIKQESGAAIDVVCFGPVSVLPQFQKRGVGSQLIRRSLEIAREMGFVAVLIYGDPRYYHRFGFRCAERYDIRTADGKYAVALMALELQPGALAHAAGRFLESPGFEIDSAAFELFDRTFPPKEQKTGTPSQLEFSIMAGLTY
jgi:putative acetyltransferase